MHSRALRSIFFTSTIAEAHGGFALELHLPPDGRLLANEVVCLQMVNR